MPIICACAAARFLLRRGLCCAKIAVIRQTQRASEAANGQRQHAVLRITIEVRGEVLDAQGVKEKLAMDLEHFGDVRVVEVLQIDAEQMKMDLPSWRSK